METLKSVAAFVTIAIVTLALMHYTSRLDVEQREEKERVQKECSKICYPYAVLSCEEDFATCADESVKWKRGKKP